MDRPFVANFAIMEIFSKQLWYKNLVLDHTLENTASIVTEQIKAQPCGAITHDPVISVVGNRFLFTGFQPQGGQEHSGSEPSFSPRSRTSLAS